MPNHGKKPRPITRRIFTLHYHGQIGYKVTHLVTSNSHTMSNTHGHPHHTSLSHLDSDKTLTLQKNENFLLITPLLNQANVRYNESSEILPKLNNFNHTHKNTRFFLFGSSHNFLKFKNR